MLIAALALLLDPTGRPQDPPPPPDPVVRIDPQIQAWLDRSPSRGDAAPGPVWDESRTFGEVSVAVGTGGYRSWGGSLSTPVGRGGRLTLHYMDSEGERRSPYDYGRGYDPTYWGGGLSADDRPLRGSDRRLESGAAGQD
ncbi:MAG TPA: hypothetical protein VGR32_08940 [Brevundimonas sp.]|uniref:hypothetical protein n=1 Tax=Brevundimonas sp. TaxID=1871086 RepID=UPI002DE9A493|nr:hypothetical protein [Brevundimonas sp.]